MEIIIVICLLIVIALLLHDKIVIKKALRKEEKSEQKNPELPDIVGRPKNVKRLAVPKVTIERQEEEPVKLDSNLDLEIDEEESCLVIPQKELDEVFADGPDFNEEEEEWRRYGEPNGEDGFATGVTFEELSTVGSLLQQEVLEPALYERAVDIVHKIQGTELFSLLESSMPEASQKIARLLDQSVGKGTDSGSSTMRMKGLEDFNIGEFV
ncbi:conjugal transfer protein TraD [Chitinophaga sp. GbtcB8]|uniref:conjugal transfer protein TraD n=1 Tax=Chitinophaga sp. GbtcB8 TaxID=2824753 RepID=UPI001C300168|nr:conjugal transfer protein TraD [Chitinophaga sp. GbtcB8]